MIILMIMTMIKDNYDGKNTYKSYDNNHMAKMVQNVIIDIDW